MSLYLLNAEEIKHSFDRSDKYHTVLTGDNYLSVCVKALEEILDNIQQAMSHSTFINDYKKNKLHGKNLTAEDLAMSYSNFDDNLNRSKELVEAFIRDMLDTLEEHDDQEGIDDLGLILERFGLLLVQIKMFGISKSITYCEKAIMISSNLLIIFKDSIVDLGDDLKKD